MILALYSIAKSGTKANLLLAYRTKLRDILSSLLVYRSIRFLILLAIALIFICCFELRQRISNK